MLAPKELRDIHPLGKSPLMGITGSSGKERIIAESGLIVEYLTDNFGKQMVPTKFAAGEEGIPGDETDEWMRYRYYLHYAEGSLIGPLVMGLVFDRTSSPFFIHVTIY